ncbi:hypothetical protein HMPREF0454_02679 [Hafnia alvei ATCC 51873]|uniref:Uncharacterized protein n=1 Tax=Hafnia alvei ATCC 51873 TaxID=1002364 RepID=G9Y7R0_HAFAL|nr:hypothetical protein HMPREF0454_02679 [Hafnia alvei ATCC 51873]
MIYLHSLLNNKNIVVPQPALSPHLELRNGRDFITASTTMMGQN